MWLFKKKLSRYKYNMKGLVIARLKAAYLQDRGIRLTAREVDAISLPVLEKEYANFIDEDSPKGEYVMGTGGGFLQKFCAFEEMLNE